MTTRTDIHRKSALVPEDYDHVLVFALPGGIDEPIGWNLKELAEMMKTKPFFRASRSTCNACGTHFRHGSVFVHRPTGEHIVVGHECAEKIEGHAMSENRRRQGLAGLERARKRAALRSLARELAPETRKALRLDHPIIRDIRGAAIRFQNLSCKQVDLVLKIAREVAERAARPVEVNVPAPVSDKRQTIRGVVVSCKTYESAYGDSLKVTVKVATERGVWLAWGTAPSALLDEGASGIGGIKGCTVEFDAVLKAGREPHFALFSRPTKAKVVAGGKPQAEMLAKIKADLEYARTVPSSLDWIAEQEKIIARLEALLA